MTEDDDAKHILLEIGRAVVHLRRQSYPINLGEIVEHLSDERGAEENKVRRGALTRAIKLLMT
ncbi:hypothetical protein MF265_23330 [Serratia marcescens]|uniref:hypothetical protein n=1 Tax=Serratia marcescens TaxID=615 RepID=UPI001EEFA85C|nr:hypothetical protein [Serratia marcescens]ULH10809.1 hypothetical protein MF265_23330 [Serratia marcescens]